MVSVWKLTGCLTLLSVNRGTRASLMHTTLADGRQGRTSGVRLNPDQFAVLMCTEQPIEDSSFNQAQSL